MLCFIYTRIKYIAVKSFFIKVQNIRVRFENKHRRGKPRYLEHDMRKHLTLGCNPKRNYLQKLLSFKSRD